jgi:hypothetical protein
MDRNELVNYITLYRSAKKSTPFADLQRVSDLVQLSQKDMPRFAAELWDAPKVIRNAALNCVELGLNGSSIGVVGSREGLVALLGGLERPPVVCEVLEGYTLATGSSRRASRAGDVTGQQRRDVQAICKKIPGLKVDLSTGGATDIRFGVGSAGADGAFEFDGFRGLFYLRWGKCSGGSQRDRMYTTIQTLKENKDKHFLVVHDGVELLDMWPNYLEQLGDSDSGFVLTAKMLPLLDWSRFVRRQIRFGDFVASLSRRNLSAVA